jgi:ABC-type lipoprotein export system ATPase subunit
VQETKDSSSFLSMPDPKESLLIQVEHLSRVAATRSQRTIILDDVSFTVPAQSLFAINGPSGSGKSTLLNLLTGIDRPTSGRVVFGGQELRGRSENALARWRGRHVGIVFQFFQLIPTLTAEENVQLALELGGGGGFPRRRWRQRSAECLQLVGLADYRRRLPSELSGGQQQRVAIARALANDPPVVVADEPTGNLDSTTAHQVFEVLASLSSRGKTVIYVTHDRDLAARSSAGVELLDGRIVERRGALTSRQSESSTARASLDFRPGDGK